MHGRDDRLSCREIGGLFVWAAWIKPGRRSMSGLDIGVNAEKRGEEILKQQEVTEMRQMPAIDMVATGQNIARLRETRGMTVRELQEIFGFATPQAIYKWQHGTALPTVDNLLVLAAVFGVHIEEILAVRQIQTAASA